MIEQVSNYVIILFYFSLIFYDLLYLTLYIVSVEFSVASTEQTGGSSLRMYQESRNSFLQCF